MAITRPTIVGVFDNASLADNAVQSLESNGFGSDQIYYSGRQTTTGNGFMAGLKSLFTGDDMAGANPGGLSDDLTGMGFSDEEAKYYENEYRAGRSVVAVRGDGNEQTAAQILQTNGAHTYATQQSQAGYANAATTRDAYQTDTSTGYTTDAARTGAYQTNNANDYTNDAVNTGAYQPDASTDEEHKLRLREEQLNVDKQNVQAGEVRLHKDVVTEQKNIDVPVTHEEAYIERRPATGSAVNDTTPIGEDETIRVPLSEEQVNVNKSTVVTGEVALGKRQVTETQRVSDTVRHEKARVEQQGDVPVSEVTNDQQ